MRYLTALILVLPMVFSGAFTAHALTISPVKVEIAGDPGQTLSSEIELLNEQSEPKTLYPSFENFEPSGDTGSPRFVGADGDLATWLKTDEVITLAPGEKKKINFTITIPSDAEPGGHFAAIFWGGQAPNGQQEGEVSIGGRLGVLILLRVNGDIAEGGGITEFAATAGHFYAQLPVSFAYRVNNTGGDRIVPLGDMTIQNTFRSGIATVPANPKEGSILPQSVRKFSMDWSEGDMSEAKGFFAHARQQLHSFHFGWYTANLSLTWGTENQKYNAAYQFFVIPWQLLSMVLAGVIVAMFGLRRYNHWIVARSTHTG